MARSDIWTILSLDEYAKIMGIAPLHFNGGRDTSDPQTFAIQNSQNPIWHQFNWQAASLISREELALEIANAERDIMHFLGYWPAPTWVSQEMHDYRKYHRPELWGNGINSQGQFKGVKLKSGRLISGGRRNVTLVGTATVAGVTLVYSDPNTDGFDTLATITLPTTLTDECEIKVYFANENGDQRWEVRPVKTKAISGGSVVITIDSWMLFDPDIVNAYPTEDITGIDATIAANYVTSIEVYREFNDFTQVTAQFFWEREPTRLSPLFPASCPSCSNAGCEACTLVAQDGCLQVRNVMSGIAAPVPATYNTTTEVWDRARSWTECREPDMVKVWYYAGEQSEFGLRGDCDKMDIRMKRIVAWLATTRLQRPFKANDNITKHIRDLQIDVSQSVEEGSFFNTEDILNNPFGTRYGEVQTYRQLKSFVSRVPRVGVAI